MERSVACHDSGADLIVIDGLRERADVERAVEQLPEVPRMLIIRDFPIEDAGALGYRIVVHWGTLLAIYGATRDVYHELATTHTVDLESRATPTTDEIQGTMGVSRYLDLNQAAAGPSIQARANATIRRPPMEQTGTLTKSDADALADQVRNWGRWGSDDERGALNFITPAKRAAAAPVREGVVVSCARSLPVTPAPDNPTPVQHYMIRGGDAQSSDGLAGSSDYFGVASHGTATTHLDALCHIFVDGEMYSGYYMREVRTDGAQKNSIMAGQDGIVCRGVLLDVSRPPRSGVTGAVRPDHGGRFERCRSAARRIGSGRRHPPRRHGAGCAPGSGGPLEPRGMRGWPVSTPIASPGCTSVASRSLAATASPTRCPAESRAGRCLCIRSQSWQWASI